MRQAMNVIAESVPGYEARARLIQARSLELTGKQLEAKELYEQVIQWADQQTEPGFINNIRNMYAEGKLWNASLGIRYVGSSARIQLGFILMAEGKFEQAFGLFNNVLLWDEVGKSTGPMDLAFAALIGAMRTCDSIDNLPWEQIQGYHDLLEALFKDNIDNFKAANNREKAAMLVRQLDLISLTEKLKVQLRILELSF
jgi:tetratricopeptide (TPR) repeat protein